MKSTSICNGPKSDKEDSNFNLLSQNTNLQDKQLSNCISQINNSAASDLNINNNLYNLEEINNINNFYNAKSNDVDSKNNKNEIIDFKNDSRIDIDNSKNNESIIDDGQLVIDSINYGYIPFFIKIEDDNPLYFIAHKKI